MALRNNQSRIGFPLNSLKSGQRKSYTILELARTVELQFCRDEEWSLKCMFQRRLTTPSFRGLYGRSLLTRSVKQMLLTTLRQAEMSEGSGHLKAK